MTTSHKNPGSLLQKLFGSKTRRPAVRSHRFNPTVEQLEVRDVPTVILGGSALQNLKVGAPSLSSSQHDTLAATTASLHSILVGQTVNSTHLDLVHATGAALAADHLTRSNAGASHTLDFAALAAPTLLGPSGSSGATPTFSWTAVAGADHYDVYVSLATDTAQLLRSPITIGTSCTFSQALAPGQTYRFWVRALDAAGNASTWSNSLDFSVPAVNLAAPTLLAPNGTTGAMPSFIWTGVIGADHYEIWVNDVTTGASKVVWNPNVTGTNLTPPALSAGHTYIFWVRALDGAGNASAWSTPMDFLVPAVNLTAPTLLGPSGTSGTTPTFNWTVVVGADHYEIWVNDVTTGTSKVVWNQNLTGFTWTSSALTTGHKYTFWMRALDGAGNASPWSSSLDFAVPVNLTTPTLLGPSGTSGTTPIFSWTGSIGADHYEIWVNDVTTGASKVVWNPNVAGTNLTASLKGGDTYQFWVRALDAAGNASAWSNFMEFLVPAVSLTAPTLLAPIGTSGTTPSYIWTGVIGADHYEIWVNDMTTGASKVVWNPNVAGTNLTSPALSTGHTYIFWVRALDGAGNASAWSDAVRFTVS